MATNFNTLQKAFKKLGFLVLFLIISPILLSMAFKAIRIYKEGANMYFSYIFLAVASVLMLFTVLFAFKTFKTFLKAIFND